MRSSARAERRATTRLLSSSAGGGSLVSLESTASPALVARVAARVRRLSRQQKRLRRAEANRREAARRHLVVSRVVVVRPSSIKVDRKNRERDPSVLSDRRGTPTPTNRRVDGSPTRLDETIDGASCPRARTSNARTHRRQCNATQRSHARIHRSSTDLLNYSYYTSTFASVRHRRRHDFPLRLQNPLHVRLPDPSLGD